MNQEPSYNPDLDSESLKSDSELKSLGQTAAVAGTLSAREHPSFNTDTGIKTPSGISDLGTPYGPDNELEDKADSFLADQGIDPATGLPYKPTPTISGEVSPTPLSTDTSANDQIVEAV